MNQIIKLFGENAFLILNNNFLDFLKKKSSIL